MGIIQKDTIGIKSFAYFLNFLNFSENILDFMVAVILDFSLLKKRNVLWGDGTFHQQVKIINPGFVDDRFVQLRPGNRQSFAALHAFRKTPCETLVHVET